MKIKKLYAIVELEVFKWCFHCEVDHEAHTFVINGSRLNDQLPLKNLIKSTEDEELQIAQNWMCNKFKNYKQLNSKNYEQKTQKA